MTVTLTGNEVVFVQGVDATGRPAATTEQTTTGAIAALANSEVTDTINTAITTVGNGTLTAAALAGGVITRSGPVAAFTDTTATAAQIYAQVGSLTGVSFITRIKNTTAYTQTIAAGSGVTLPTAVIIPPFSVGSYLVTVNTNNTATVVHIETGPRTTAALEVATALTTVGAGTITAAGIAGGVTSRGGSQSATPFTDTTDTADLIIAAVPNASIGMSFEYTYTNNTDAVATLTGGSGVTVSRITKIPANGSARYLVTYTAASTVTMVGIATLGFSSDATDGTKLIGFKSSGETTGKTALIAAVNTNDATYTLPAATDTLAGIGTAQTWTAVQTFTNSDIKLLGSSTGATTFTSANSGASNFTLTFPGVTDTLAALGTAQTWTAVQTFTNSDIKLLGSSTGATTFTSSNAGATNYTLTLPAVSGANASTSGSNLFIADVTKCSGSVTVNGSTTYVNVTGLTQTVVPGTYQFVCRLPSTVASGTGGIKYAFHYTTTVVSSIEATGRGFTASAVAVQHTTTTTDVADLFSQAAVVIFTEITGTMVVGTGGTIDLQMAQNTSNGSNTITLIGASMEFIRIA